MRNGCGILIYSAGQGLSKYVYVSNNEEAIKLMTWVYTVYLNNSDWITGVYTE